MELPKLIDEIIDENKELQVGSDTVIDELREKNPDLLKALYLLTFKENEFFKNRAKTFLKTLLQIYKK